MKGVSSVRRDPPPIQAEYTTPLIVESLARRIAVVQINSYLYVNTDDLEPI